jgi:hypothetical protein
LPDRTHRRVMTCYLSCRTQSSRGAFTVFLDWALVTSYPSQSRTNQACHDGHYGDTVASFIRLSTVPPCRPIAPSPVQDLSYPDEDSRSALCRCSLVPSLTPPQPLICFRLTGDSRKRCLGSSPVASPSISFRVACYDRSYAAVPTQHCRAWANSTESTGLTRQARATPARAWATTWLLLWPVVMITGTDG